MLDIAIIGAGLTGLSLAQQLHDRGNTFIVFEAGERPGGRIISQATSRIDSKLISATEQDFKYDLGPGWIWPDSQPRIADFIDQHGIDIYPQWCTGKALYQVDRNAAPQAYYDESTYAPARRIQGGTYRLVETLLQYLPEDLLKLNHRLDKVTDHHDHIELQFSHTGMPLKVKARKVVMTIPPRLLANAIAFNPRLDVKLHKLMCNTPTWMAGHAKAVIHYSRPFWRESGFSGNAMAAYQGAALMEIFDACSANGEQAALSGFFALPAALRQQYRDDLEALILEQLVRLFGKEAAQPEEIIIKDWFAEALTATPADEILPQSHPQYGHRWLQLDHWKDKLYFAGTETAEQFGGYLEGALESSERVARTLLL